MKCKSADKYTGKRPPKCNGGQPCEVCREIYLKARVTRIGVLVERGSVTCGLVCSWGKCKRGTFHPDTKPLLDHICEEHHGDVHRCRCGYEWRDKQ